MPVPSDALDRERFTLLDSGSFIILQRRSGWYDHCTWAKLRDKATGQEAIYAATHLPTVPDTQWAVKGLQATTVVVEELAKIAEGLPIVLGGDFNTTEKSRGYYTYQYMVGQAGYQDCRYAAPEADNSGTARIWGTQTLAISLLPKSVHGTLNALSIFNADGALKGDAIYIASIEFLK